jgi:hypothetical protein
MFDKNSPKTKTISQHKNPNIQHTPQHAKNRKKLRKPKSPYNTPLKKKSLLPNNNTIRKLDPKFTQLPNHPHNQQNNHTTFSYKSWKSSKQKNTTFTLKPWTRNSPPLSPPKISQLITKHVYISEPHNPHFPHKNLDKIQSHPKKILHKIPNYTYLNTKSLLKCGEIEINPGPKFTFLLNHPQIHLEKQKTYFYNKTIQIKLEYKHIFETFKPYLSHTQTINTNPHLKQFCMDNSHCTQNYLFYTILITLAPTLTHCNQIIGEIFTQWTTKLIKNLTESINPLPTDQHKLINFHLETHILLYHSKASKKNYTHS